MLMCFKCTLMLCFVNIDAKKFGGVAKMGSLIINFYHVIECVNSFLVGVEKYSI